MISKTEYQLILNYLKHFQDKKEYYKIKVDVKQFGIKFRVRFNPKKFKELKKFKRPVFKTLTLKFSKDIPDMIERMMAEELDEKKLSEYPIHFKQQSHLVIVTILEDEKTDDIVEILTEFEKVKCNY